MKILVNDPSTFVGDRGYHLEEGAEMNGLGPRTAAKTSRGQCLNAGKSQPNFPVQPSRHRHIWAVAKLAAEVSSFSEDIQLWRAVQGSSGDSDRPKAVRRRREREETRGKREMEEKKKKLVEWPRVKPRLSFFFFNFLILHFNLNFL